MTTEDSLAAWAKLDAERALHPADHLALRSTEPARSLVAELLMAGAERDLWNACARLGGMMADEGVSDKPAFTLGDEQNETSFVSRAIRVNGVVRWEYCSGSAIYFVWQQTRDGTAVLDDASLAREASRVFGVPAKNVIHLKASYRFGR